MCSGNRSRISEDKKNKRNFYQKYVKLLQCIRTTDEINFFLFWVFILEMKLQRVKKKIRKHFCKSKPLLKVKVKAKAKENNEN